MISIRKILIFGLLLALTLVLSESRRSNARKSSATKPKARKQTNPNTRQREEEIEIEDPTVGDEEDAYEDEDEDDDEEPEIPQPQRNNIPEQPSKPDIREEVRQREYATRDANRMNYENIESYTIKAEGVDSFYLTPEVDQLVKCELYIYWKEANIFISSEYKEGEEVRVIVYEDDQRIIYDSSFYMVNGFGFEVRGGSSYEVRFLSMGKIGKLVSLTISKMLEESEELAETDDLLEKEQKISNVRAQIQAFFTISERNYMIEQQLSQEVLTSTKAYMGYGVLEMCLILTISILQTVFINRVLSTSSIV